MKTFIWFLVFSCSFAHADIWDGNLTVTQRYACIGFDGVPIPLNTAAANNCCSGGGLKSNLPPECKSGFNNILVNAAEGANTGFTIAKDLIEINANFDGNEMNYNNGTTNEIGSLTESESAASIAGGDGRGITGKKSSKSALSKGSGSSGSAGRSGSGSGTAGGFGSGDLLGNSESSLAKKKKSARGADDSSEDEGSRMKYVSSAGTNAAKDSDGESMAVEGALKGDVDLTGGAGSGKDGDENGGLNGGADGSDADGDLANANATTEDPGDYFKRIDKSANIFKIVSARYMKKKGLWNQPAKPQDQLKPKKI